ncbi:putative adhesin [Chitinophaga niastensis]|uniref:Putative adhesin n=1 Tax=Chitinophaga niastensis TaxID=536980 RepID=A0A2P8HPK8_CHINA|nr:DUF4097 family beta strand repeat-containing protein [Chitinophaga niastensis]PSL48132.1 putative adhesin [Chitinophaga niastensis]
MKLKFKCLLLLLLPLVSQAYNNGTTYKKIINKEFAVSNNAVLSISNKYGKIILHAWNKNEIKATITVTGFGKKESEAQSIADIVDVATDKNSPTAVALRTVYNPSKQSSGWFSWGGKIDSKDYVNIDYEVYIPQSLQRLIIDNQFGDVIADKFTFPADLALNYCTYDIREAEDLSLKINYCDKGKIGKAGKVNVKGNYSTMRGEQLGSLEASSNYSEYTITKLGTLSISANYDDYKIEQVEQVSGRCTYSDVRLNELQHRIDLRMTYGDVVIKKTSMGFKGADLQVTYADVKIAFPRKQPLSLDVNLVYGDLGTGGLELKNVSSNKKGSTLIYSAQAGSGSEPAAQIKIRGTNTDVKLEAF